MTTIPTLPALLVTDRLHIRPFVPDDAGVLFSAVDQSRERVGQWLPWVRFYQDRSAAETFIETAQERWRDAGELPFGLFARETGALLGGISVHGARPGQPIDWAMRSFETGYWLRDGAEGQGFMREAVRAIIRLVFRHFGAVRLALRCDERNLPSRRVAEASGFQLDRIGRHDLLNADGLARDTCYFSVLDTEAQALLEQWNAESCDIIPGQQSPEPERPPAPPAPSAFPADLPRPERIETERLIIRPALPDDAGALLDLLERSRETLDPWIPFARRIQTVEDASRFCEGSIQQAAVFRRFDLHAFTRDRGELIGGGTLHNIEWDIPALDLGWWLGSAWTGQGYGYEIAETLRRFAAEQWHIDRISAWCHIDNLASRKLALRIGLQQEGIARRAIPDPAGLLSDWVVFSQIAADRVTALEQFNQQR